MADDPRYLPARHPVSDPKSGLISRPWLAFFQRLTGGTINLTTTVGTLTYSALPAQAARTLLGRGSSGAGVPEVLTLGAGLVMSGTTLSVATTEPDAVAVGRWEPLTSGIVATPELIYASGDVVSVWVRD